MHAHDQNIDDARAHEEQQAREALANLTPETRKRFLDRMTTTPMDERELANAKIIHDCGSVTWLGQVIRDGWTCEDCDEWSDASTEHCSAYDCNETGEGVVLCEACAIARDVGGGAVPAVLVTGEA